MPTRPDAVLYTLIGNRPALAHGQLLLDLLAGVAVWKDAGGVTRETPLRTAVANGLALLDSTGKLPAAQLGSAATPAGGDNSTKIATTAFVQTAVSAAVAALLAGAPGALDTLRELADAIGDDANFAAGVTTALAARLRVDAAQSLTGPQQTQARSNIGAGAFGDTLFTSANVSAAVAALGYSQSLTNDGRVLFPNGLFLQWGRTVITTDGSSSGMVLYPVSMPNETLLPFAWNGDSASQPQATISSNIASGYPTASAMVVHADGVGSGQLVRINWLALGK